MKSCSVLIKPASSACNLRCSYCFYLDETANRTVRKYPFLTIALAEKLISRLYAAYDTVDFAFQGGEPSLVGLDWFRKFHELEAKYNGGKVQARFSFQTNGTNIDNQWAVFFKEKGYLVGVSLDGFSRLHNTCRTKVDGTGSFHEVMDGLKALREAGTDFNILTVVTDVTVRNIDRMWDFFMSNGLYYQQYIPCIDPISGATDRYLTSENYGRFLVRLYDLWESAVYGGYPIYNRLFDNFLGILLGYEPEACDMRGHCSIQYVIEGNGDVFPCDFYCLDAYRLGNIESDTIEEIDRKRRDIRYIEASINTADECRTCPYAGLCRGGCRRYRDDDGHFRFCTSYKYLFDNRLDRFRALAESVADERKRKQ
ncbi:MAG: SPASM domain-containing protein [Spirochaetia bacterium]|jgi:uncharacterized protein|nr:SPASM domain-containing protein [Spirochaetia bacterium]